MHQLLRAHPLEAIGLGGRGPDGIVIYARMLPAVPGSVPRIRRELGAALVPCAMDARRRTDIELFVTEAAANSVRHAYLGEPGPLYTLAGIDGERLVVAISDWGRGLPSGSEDPDTAANPEPAGAGLGLALMTRLADDVTIDSDESGTDVEGSFALAGVAGPAADVRASRSQMLREYLRVLQERNDAVNQDTAAVIAEAQQAVAHSRRRRLARHQPG